MYLQLPHISHKLNLVKAFTRKPLPIFANDEEFYIFLTWNLYDRIAEAIQSFILLCENERYQDAFILAGHVLETCSILSYIHDNPSKEKKLKNLHKYSARGIAGILISSLAMDENLSKPIAWQNYAVHLKLFYTHGACIIKKQKGEQVSSKDKHQQVIDKLNTRLGLNADKIRLIHDNYESPDAYGYIKAFKKRLRDTDNRLMETFYDKYCAYKHANLFSVGMLKENMDEYIVDWMLDIVLLVIGYLDKTALELPDHKV